MRLKKWQPIDYVTGEGLFEQVRPASFLGYEGHNSVRIYLRNEGYLNVKRSHVRERKAVSA